MKKYLILAAIILVSIFSFKGTFVADDKSNRLEILLLGHNSEHHFSEKFAEIVSQQFFKDGINISYTTDLNDLNEANLSKYDGLMIYANYDTISAGQEKALLNFVKGGKGFIPVHCASFCFQNSPEYINMVGGQFKEHKTGTFAATIIDAKHPVMKGVNAFSTWDETYVHDKIAKDIHVLTERVEGSHHEPYTWVKNYGKGKVFYTAYGHDQRSWKNPEFLRMLKNGILWSVNDAAKKDWNKLAKPLPEYSDAKLPNYEKRPGGFQLQAPLSAKESQLLTQVPVDFKVELFASEPDITKPIAMAWDEKGRLWIVETIDYPNTVRDVKGEGQDRIKICEDTDGDGKADKFTVFADKLNIPTSITFANGGVIIAQAPDFIFLKDTDGDDKANIREKLISGWGTYDTHAGPSSLKYGLDNRIWGTVGYSGFNGKVGEQRMKFGQGVYSFSSNGNNMEFLGGTSNNTWGIGFSENNDVFISTANNTHSAFLGIPSLYLSKIGKPADQSVEKIDGHYAMHVVTKNLRQVDVHNGFTAAAGHNLYTARNFPKKYWNRIAFVNEPTGRVVHEAILEPNGSGFREKDGWNFMASADEWFGPVQSEVGPDGAVWVLDWYNFIIQHNPTPEGFENGKGNAYINPLRDRTHGRVYKIVSRNATASKIKSLDKKDPKSLISGLESDNMFWRTTAQRLIVEGGDKQIAPALYKLIRDKKVDELGINAPAIHALWTLKGLGLFEGDNSEAFSVAVEALNHPSSGVRKAALQVLPNNSASLAAILKAGLLSDSNLNTRLAAVLRISELPAAPTLVSTLQAAEKLSQNSEDKWLGTAFTIALKRHMPTAVADSDVGKKTASGSAAAKSPVAKVDQVIKISPIVNAMKFDLKTFTVKAGSTVEVVFKNIDFMQHNLLILQKGSIDKVGAASDKLAQDPKGAALQYVPRMPEVLFHTALVNPEGSETLRFKVPAAAGNYPYICSFPGHWRIMNGIMKVVL
jgi:putative membrane-bound dehydrogenase-like protein